LSYDKAGFTLANLALQFLHDYCCGQVAGQKITCVNGLQISWQLSGDKIRKIKRLKKD